MSETTIAWTLSSIFYAPKNEVSNYQAVHITLTGVRGVFSPALGYAVMKILEYRVFLLSFSVFIYAWGNNDVERSKKLAEKLT